MADLTPNERAALQAAIEQWYLLPADDESSSLDAIWRAARAYQAEQDARICDERAELIAEQYKDAFLHAAAAIRHEAGCK